MGKDNFTREQDLAIRCIDRNVIVSAGAGSGKTRVLVERFLYILEHGASAGAGNTALAPGILAVTFTRKAAAEMRQRIRQELLRRMQGGKGKTGLWEKELKALPRTTIGTLHSLCSAILRANPVECGLDPSFAVLEENEYGEFLRTQLRDLLRRQLQAKNPEAERLCEEYGSQSLLKQLFSLLTGGYGGNTSEQPQDPYGAALRAVGAAAGRLGQALTETLAEESSPANRGWLLGHLREARQALSDLSRPENIAILQELNGGLKRIGRNKEEISQLKELLETVQGYPHCLRAQKLAAVWEAYLPVVLQELRRAKLEAGVLAFDDLEEMALELLSGHPTVLKKCRSQFRYIMVDEFQDTNRRQRQLIYLLAGGDKDRLRGNRLFVVGDPKQSIYRFRGAEVSVFSGVRQEIEANGGASIQLADNFRTVEPILALCNLFFPDLMGTKTVRPVFYAALKPHRPSTVKPELRVFRFPPETGTGDRRQKEAEGLALRLKELHEKEQIAYQDMAVLLQNMTHIGRMTAALQKNGVPCAVVDGRGFYDRMEIRDLTGLFTFFTDPHNDLALLAVLRSVYMGIDDETLTRLCLLQREAAGKTAGQGNAGKLSLWSFWGRLLNTEPEQEGAEEPFNGIDLTPLKRPRKILHELQTKAALLNLPDFCRALEEALHPETVLALQPNGEGQVADYHKFITLARTFAVQKQGTVEAFAAWLRKMQREEVREAAANAFAEDAVTLMTVHKSKGLEFPLVVVPFMDTRPQADTDPIAWLPGKGLGISVQDAEGELLPSTVLQDIRKENRKQELEEKARLLYVAMTRAKNRLILTGSVVEKEGKAPKTGAGKAADTQGNKEAKHWLDWFRSFKEKSPDEFGKGLDIVEVRPTPDGENGAEVAAPEALVRNGEVDFAVKASAVRSEAGWRIEPVPSCGSGRIMNFSASALQEYEHCPRRYYYQMMERIPPLEPDAVQGKLALPAAVLGNIVHRTLEKLSRKAMEETPEQALAACHSFFVQAVEEFAEGRLNLAEEARLMLEAYIRDPLYQEFVKKQKYAEYAFSLALPHPGPETATASAAAASQPFIFTGVMDAVAVDEDGSLEIIDYKSGQPPVEDDVRKGYAWQLALYRLAAEKLLEAPVRSVSLHFLRNRKRWILPDGDYRACLTEIGQVCREIAGKTDEEEFRTELSACGTCPFAYLCRR